MDHTKLEEQRLAEMYLSGQLPSEQRGAFEVHLVGCEECRDRVLLAEMFRSRAPNRTEPQPQKKTAPAHANGSGTGSNRANGVLSPLELARALAPPFPTSPVEPSSSETPRFQDEPSSGSGRRASPRVPPPFYSVPHFRSANPARSPWSRRPRPWSRPPAPSGSETIAFRPVTQPADAGRGRRVALAIGLLFAAAAGYLAATATPLLHGSGGEIVTAYPVTAPAPTREEALALIIEQTNVVLGGQRITLSLIRSAFPGYGQNAGGRVYQVHLKRVREYHGIFQKEYQSLLELYKTNQGTLQKADIMFLQAATIGAEDVEKNMRQLEDLSPR